MFKLFCFSVAFATLVSVRAVDISIRSLRMAEEDYLEANYTIGDCQTSIGDLDAGLLSVQDMTCVTEGKAGCIGDTGCRLCRTRQDSQFQEYAMCEQVNEPKACEISSGDQQAGLSLLYDERCNEGGVGCLADDTCRFCRRRDAPMTDINRNYPECKPATMECTTEPKEQERGIRVYKDFTCSKKQMTDLAGCFDGMCRLCAGEGNENAEGYHACPPFVGPPADDDKVPEDPVCPKNDTLVQSDQVSWLSDPICAADNIQGCFGVRDGTPCRYCNTADSLENGYMSCADALANMDPNVDKIREDDNCKPKQVHIARGYSYQSDPTCTSDDTLGCFGVGNDYPCRYCLAMPDIFSVLDECANPLPSATELARMRQ